MKYVKSLGAIALSLAIMGCGGSGSKGTNGGKGGNEGNGGNGKETKVYNVTVEDGAVFHALVVDSAGLEAKDNGSNVYSFSKPPKYPVIATPTDTTFIDLDGDKQASEGDKILKVGLKSCSANITPISTLVAHENLDCDPKKVAQTYERLSKVTKIPVDELKKLPSKQSVAPLKDGLSSVSVSLMAYDYSRRNIGLKELVDEFKWYMENANELKEYNDKYKEYAKQNKSNLDIEKMETIDEEKLSEDEVKIINKKLEERKNIKKDSLKEGVEYYGLYVNEDNLIQKIYTFSKNETSLTRKQYNEASKQWVELPKTKGGLYLENGKVVASKVSFKDGIASVSGSKDTLKMVGAVPLVGKNLVFEGAEKVDFKDGSLKYILNIDTKPHAEILDEDMGFSELFEVKDSCSNGHDCRGIELNTRNASGQGTARINGDPSGWWEDTKFQGLDAIRVGSESVFAKDNIKYVYFVKLDNGKIAFINDKSAKRETLYFYNKTAMDSIKAMIEQ